MTCKLNKNGCLGCHEEHKYYLNELGKFLGEEDKYAPPKILYNKVNYKCCDNINVIYDSIARYYVCCNCGVIHETNYEETFKYNKKGDLITSNINVLQKSYSTNTYVSNNGPRDKRFHILKTHQIRQNYNHKETKIRESYDDIDIILNFLNITDKSIHQKSKMLYNDIYISDNITSRRKIKQSLLIYCVLKVLDNKEIKYDIFKILRHFNITIKQFNSAIKKVDGQILPEKLEITYGKLQNYLTISLEDVIEHYNKKLKIKEEKKIRVNNNTVFLYCIYNLIKKKINKTAFCNFFGSNSQTLNNTIKKFEGKNNEE